MLSLGSAPYCSLLCVFMKSQTLAEVMINPYTWQGRVSEDYNKTWTGYVEAKTEQRTEQIKPCKQLVETLGQFSTQVRHSFLVEQFLSEQRQLVPQVSEISDLAVYLKGMRRDVSLVSNLISGFATYIMKQVLKFYLHPTLNHIVTLTEFRVFGEFEICEYNLKVFTLKKELVLCGLFSNFNLYPGNPEVQYIFSFFFTQNFVCKVKFDLISSGVVETSFLGLEETYSFLDTISFLLNEKSHVYKFNFVKHCQVLISGSQGPDMRLTVFDGPGILSHQHILQGKQFSHLCKTYTCSLFTTISLKNWDLLQIFYSNITVGYSHRNTNSSRRNIWKIQGLGQNGECLVGLILSASDSSKISVFVDNFTLLTTSDFNC